MSKTSIEWTEQVWNPVRGCSRVSPGCQNCYAERMAARFCRSIDHIPCPRVGQTHDPFHGFARMTANGGQWTGTVELIESMLDIPLRRKKPTTWFVNSMSDLFHESLPDEAIDRVFAVMALCPQHVFQCLTKRAGRMRKYFERPSERMTAVFLKALGMGKLSGRTVFSALNPEHQLPLPNVRLGVSVEDQQRADERISELLKLAGAGWGTMVSAEPLLGKVDLSVWLTRWTGVGSGLPQPLSAALERLPDVPGLGWVIVGGESGPGARPCDLAWIRSIVAQCKAAGVPCFVKQLGARPILDTQDQIRMVNAGLCDSGKRDSKGGDPSEWPEDLRVREMPEGVK